MARDSFINSGMLQKTTGWAKNASWNIKSQCNCNLNVRKRLFLKNSCTLRKYVILQLLTFFFSGWKSSHDSYTKDCLFLHSNSLKLYSNPRLCISPLCFALVLLCPRLAFLPRCDQFWRNHVHGWLFLRDAQGGNKLLSGQLTPPEKPVCCPLCTENTFRTPGCAKYSNWGQVTDHNTDRGAQWSLYNVLMISRSSGI